MSVRIGFYICHCGINIAYRVRVEEVADYIRGLQNVVVARDYKFMCSDPGQEMIEKDINCPMTSSCGRLFDAVAALTGLRMKNSFEGQAAMELEQIADESEHGVYPFTIDETCNGALRINFSPMIAAISEGVQAGTELGVISMRFHNTIVGALFDICTKIDKGNAIHDRRRVCLSGGCFQNAILMTKLKKLLVDKGFTVYTHSLVPPGDGGVALGQAAIAAHLHKTK